jgi:hypothetical protein
MSFWEWLLGFFVIEYLEEQENIQENEPDEE